MGASGIKFRVVRWKSVNVSEEHVAYVFQVEEYARNQHEADRKRGFILVSWLAYSSTLRMQTTCSSETLVKF
jgi:hypothetical protein